MLKFKMLSGDIDWKRYGAKFVSKRLNNGDFDYWIVLEVTNMHEATGDEDREKYYVTLTAVSPESVSQKNIDRALSCCGFSDEEIEERAQDPLLLVEALSDYGIFAVLWQGTGNNIRQLMKTAHKEAFFSSRFFGFYMDRSMNMIGQTGWDLIAGKSPW
jgi:hypothetical protein